MLAIRLLELIMRGPTRRYLIETQIPPITVSPDVAEIPLS